MINTHSVTKKNIISFKLANISVLLRKKMDFINRSTIEIAKDLLGQRLVHKTDDVIYSGYIVETEAYLGEIDKAAHGFSLRRSPKVESLYKEGGTIYAHEMHSHLLINFVTQDVGDPQGVLIRAIEPELGIKHMEKNRNRKGIHLTNGPGKFTKAMAIPKSLNGKKLGESPLYLDEKIRKYPKKIFESPRIGIPNKGEWTDMLLRFSVDNHPYVSRIKKSQCVSCEEAWL